MKQACVIGWPISHSRSPIIHGYWLQRYGIDGRYTKEAVKPDDAAEFLRTLEQRGFVGCNVTVPLKEIAFATADEIDASARAVGAANTIWLEDGRLCAANTDSIGFITHLTQEVPRWKRIDRPAIVLGAGGAARAIVHGLVEAGVGRIIVINRTRERADALARQFGPGIVALDWSKRNAVCGEASIIVNTTSLGMKGEGTLDMNFASCQHSTVVADIVYVPLETEFLAAARRQGLKTLDGLGMLMHQAVPGFEKWFGVRPEVTDELRALLVADIEAAS